MINKTHKTFFKKIFSVDNELRNNIKHKIIYILGIKISFKCSISNFKKNSFILWEPTATYHGEIIPGYAKYLLDLGYNVYVLMDNIHLTNGLFGHFKHKRLHLNPDLGDRANYFKRNGIPKNCKGILITSMRYAYTDTTNYDNYYACFLNKEDHKKIIYVDHEAKPPIDKGFWKDDTITLAPIKYKGAKSVVVNPHYFGEIKKKTRKNKITDFVVVGALKYQYPKRDFKLLFDAVEKFKDLNFKVTIIGQGDASFIPEHLRKFFDIKGRVDFTSMYKYIEQSDFILALLDDKAIKEHIRYITTGTSGTYQLSYGFNKPCIILDKYAQNRFLNNKNALIYGGGGLALKNLSNMRLICQISNIKKCVVNLVKPHKKFTKVL